MNRGSQYRGRRGLGALLFASLIVASLAAHGIGEDETNATTHSSAQPEQDDLEETIRKSQKEVQKDRSARMKNYWKRTFAEIKDLQVLFPETSPLLTRWKLLLEEDESLKTTLTNEQEATLSGPTAMGPKTRKQRFDGFRSWDRLLQEWSDDVAYYVERKTVESGSYPMSTFGRPTSGGEQQQTDFSEAAEEDPIVSHAASIGSNASNQGFPRPVQAGEAMLPHTDISDKSKSIWIVTTASLPWMTGTGVNALLRAAYLTKKRKEAGGKVTLMLPWLENQADQERVYGKDRTFDTPEDQETYVRTWLRESANMKEASEVLNIAWYPARQEPAENSLYSMGDITALIPADEVDICILEEPEHLNWYRAPGENWTTKFKHVVGIIHTNYFFYATEQPAAFIRAPAMRLLCSWMCRAHCHRVIKLSGTLGKFAPEKELVENVHGVRETFLDIGKEVGQSLVSKKANNLVSKKFNRHPVFAADAEPTVYFIGKMLWSKGLGSLMELLKYAEESAGLKLHVDMYGGGPDQNAAEAKSKKLDVDMEYHGPVDHSKLAFSHKIFVNPSTSEVLCTTAAEALAMGKFVVLPSHPSNDFFAQFPNCLPYTNKEEFVGNMYYALTHSPAPLTEEYAYALSWAAATKRLEAAGSISVEEAELMAEVVESPDTGVEIGLPLLIDDDAQRRKLSSTLTQSRDRYRQFRSRLSEEIKQSKVLPKELQRRLAMELDKRFDLDIDTVLDSPKLRLQLAPAELDKRLLSFYNEIGRSPSGDTLRVIGGGAKVGMQNLYMKNVAQKQRERERNGLAFDPAFDLPAFTEDDDETDEKARTPTQWVTLALRKNLPSQNSDFASKPAIKAPKNDAPTKMTMHRTTSRPATRLPTRQWTSGPLI